MKALQRRKNAENRRRDDGFTLVELLVTMSIVAIISGIVYSSFSHALRSYSNDASKMTRARAMRNGLQQLSSDMSNAIADATDQDLMFLFQDMLGPGGFGQDMISFVTSTEPNAAETESLNNGAPPSLAGTAQSSSAATDNEDGEEQPQAASDLIRVAYLVAASPDAPPAESEELQTLALLKVTSPTLNLEGLLGDTGAIQDIDAMLNTLMAEGAEVETIVDSALSLEFAFFDGEEWTSLWNVEEQGAPLAVRAALTVGDPSNPEAGYTRSASARIAVTSIPNNGGGGGN